MKCARCGYDRKHATKLLNGSLMEATAQMPTLAFVLAAEDIEFRQVIGISDRG